MYSEQAQNQMLLIISNNVLFYFLKNDFPFKKQLETRCDANCQILVYWNSKKHSPISVLFHQCQWRYSFITFQIGKNLHHNYPGNHILALVYHWWALQHKFHRFDILLSNKDWFHTLHRRMEDHTCNWIYRFLHYQSKYLHS